MAGPGGREVGRVSAKVLPDTSSFARSLEAYLQRVERRLRVNIPVSLDAGDVARTEAVLDLLARDRKVELDVDSSGIDRIAKSFNKIGGGGGGIGFLSPGVIAAVTAALGALGAIAPAVLASILGPIAAVVVGFDGIKRAAENLILPFKVMQTTVSNAFEKGLTPVFANLEKIMPTLTAGFVQMADALSFVADIIVNRLTSTAGLQAISDIFTSIKNAIVLLGPGIGAFVDSVLLLAERGAKSFEKFAPLLSAVFEKFNAILDFLDRVGLLQDAMDFLALAIIAVIAAFGAIVLIVVIVGGVFAKLVKLALAMPGKIRGALSALLGVVVGVFRAAWNAGASAFTAGISRVLSLAKSIPGKIKSAVGNLGGVLIAAGKAVIQGLINGITAKLGALKSKLSAVSGFIKAHKGPETKDRTLLVNAGQLIMQGLINGMESKLPDIESSLRGVTDTIASTGASLRFTAGADFGNDGAAATALVPVSGDVTLHPDSRVTVDLWAKKVVDRNNKAGAIDTRFART